MKENGGTLSIDLEGRDPDRDDIYFELDHSHELPLKGNATLSMFGVLQYRPCENCRGNEAVKLFIKERRYDQEDPLETAVTLFIEIQWVNKNPHMFVVGMDGNLKVPTENGQYEWLVEQNVPYNVKYRDLVGLFGAVDVDGIDGVMFRTQPPAMGQLRILQHIPEHLVAKSDNCTANNESVGFLQDFLINSLLRPNNSDTLLLPCDFLKAVPADRFGVTATVTAYQPEPWYYGRDQFLV